MWGWVIRAMPQAPPLREEPMIALFCGACWFTRPLWNRGTVARPPPEHWVRRLLDVQGDARLRDRRISAEAPSAWAGRLDMRVPGPLIAQWTSRRQWRARWVCRLMSTILADLGTSPPTRGPLRWREGLADPDAMLRGL